MEPAVLPDRLGGAPDGKRSLRLWLRLLTCATAIEQRRGTAPGLICPVGDKVIYAVPGVPYEMQAIMTGAILPVDGGLAMGH